LKGGVSENNSPLYQKSIKSNTTNKNNNLTDTNSVRFKKPTFIEVDLYCADRKNNVDANAFIDFYESKDWMVGSNKMKDWKAAVRTWERRETKKDTMSKLDQQLSNWQAAKKLL
jgi:hypothetical protein